MTPSPAVFAPAPLPETGRRDAPHAGTRFADRAPPPAHPERGWRILLAELVGTVLATLGGAAFGTLLGMPGAVGGAVAGALVGGSAVAAGRAGQRYGWSTAPHSV